MSLRVDSWFVAFALSSLVAVSAVSATGCVNNGGGDDDSMMDAGMDAGSDAAPSPTPTPTPTATAGPVTIKAVGWALNPTPIANALVSVNAADGSPIAFASGLTDSTGTFTANNIPPGASISVGAKVLGGQPLLLTTFGVQPNGTYQFQFPQPAPTQTPKGTLNITVSNYPTGTDQFVLYMPKDCASGSLTNIPILPSCLQSDGKLSFYILAEPPAGTVSAYQVVTDLTINAGTNNVTVSSWNESGLPPGQEIDFINAPGTILANGGLNVGGGVFFDFYRKGQMYTPGTINGAISFPQEGANTYLFVSQFPGGFMQPGSDGGYIVSFGGGFQVSPDQTYAAGFIRRINEVMPTNAYFSLALGNELPSSIALTASMDASDLAHLKASWTTASPSAFDGMFTISEWLNSSAETIAWLAKAPADLGAISLPTLPAAMSEYEPNTANPQYLNPEVLGVDLSYIDGAQDFTQNADVYGALSYGDYIFSKTDPTAEGGIRFTGAVATEPSGFSAHEMPAEKHSRFVQSLSRNISNLLSR